MWTWITCTWSFSRPSIRGPRASTSSKRYSKTSPSRHLHRGADKSSSLNLQVGKLLGLTPGALTDIRVGRAEVTFKVVGNNKNYNSTDVVDKIGVCERPAYIRTIIINLSIIFRS